jgi:hypothetical protein
MSETVDLPAFLEPGGSIISNRVVKPRDLALVLLLIQHFVDFWGDIVKPFWLVHCLFGSKFKIDPAEAIPA